MSLKPGKLTEKNKKLIEHERKKEDSAEPDFCEPDCALIDISCERLALDANRRRTGHSFGKF